MMKHCCFPTALGEMVAIADHNSLTGLWFVGEKHAPAMTAEFHSQPEYSLFRELRAQLEAYFSGRLRVFDLPLAPAGTPFQMAVWKHLRAIPFGETTTYGALARQLAEQRNGTIPAAQAVGGAVGRNPITIIIPCHRVIGADGSLTGYAGGLDRKAALLALEQGHSPAGCRLYP